MKRTYTIMVRQGALGVPENSRKAENHVPVTTYDVVVRLPPDVAVMAVQLATLAAQSAEQHHHNGEETYKTALKGIKNALFACAKPVVHITRAWNANDDDDNGDGMQIAY